MKWKQAEKDLYLPWGMLGTTCLCLLKGLTGGCWLSISPGSSSHASSFFLYLMMVFLWAPWDAHQAALYPWCPPSAVPDPTILAAPGPSTWMTPLFFGCMDRQEQVPSVMLAAHKCHCKPGEGWRIPGFLMDL